MEETESIAIKFRLRGNARWGAYTSAHASAPRHMAWGRVVLPIHAFWRPVAETCESNNPLCRTVSANSVNQQMKAVTTKMRYDQGRRYLPIPSEWAANGGIRIAAATVEQITKSGACGETGYESYRCLQAEEGINISELLKATVNSDINETEPELHPTDQKLRTRVEKISLATRREKPHGITGNRKISRLRKRPILRPNTSYLLAIRGYRCVLYLGCPWPPSKVGRLRWSYGVTFGILHSVKRRVYFA